MSETSELIEELRWFLDSDWPHQKALHATVTKAASLIASQTEEIERLKGVVRLLERGQDAQKKLLEKLHTGAQAYRDAAKAESEGLKAIIQHYEDDAVRLIRERDEAREALKPFASEPLSSELGHMKTRLFSFDDFDEKISKARAALAPEGK